MTMPLDRSLPALDELADRQRGEPVTADELTELRDRLTAAADELGELIIDIFDALNGEGINRLDLEDALNELLKFVKAAGKNREELESIQSILDDIDNDFGELIDRQARDDPHRGASWISDRHYSRQSKR